MGNIGNTVTKSHSGRQIAAVGWLSLALCLGSLVGPVAADPLAIDSDTARNELQSAVNRTFSADFVVTRTLSYAGTDTTVLVAAADAQSRVVRIDNVNSFTQGFNDAGAGTITDIHSDPAQFFLSKPNNRKVCLFVPITGDKRTALVELGIQGFEFAQLCVDTRSKSLSDLPSLIGFLLLRDRIDPTQRLAYLAEEPDVEEVTKEVLPDGATRYMIGTEPGNSGTVTVGPDGLVSSLVRDMSASYDAPTLDSDSYSYGTAIDVTAPTRGVRSGKRLLSLLAVVNTHINVKAALTKTVEAANAVGDPNLKHLRAALRAPLRSAELKTRVSVSGSKLVVTFKDTYTHRVRSYKVKRTGNTLVYPA
jgi:hypothetical protein